MFITVLILGDPLQLMSVQFLIGVIIFEKCDAELALSRD